MINEIIKQQLREYIYKHYPYADFIESEPIEKNDDFLQANKICDYIPPQIEPKDKIINDCDTIAEYCVIEPLQRKSACIKKDEKFATKPKFAQVLIKFIDSKNMTDSQCYKKAGVDRRLFSKIRNDKDYTPSKKTVFAFVFALQLSVQEAQELMESAGYAISYSYLRDVIVLYCLENKIYNLYDVNVLLEENGAEMILFE